MLERIMRPRLPPIAGGAANISTPCHIPRPECADPTAGRADQDQAQVAAVEEESGEHTL
jgi:hypothetical protein